MEFTGVKREGHGFYGIYIAGVLTTMAHNPKAAQAKFDKEVARAQMNAKRAASVAEWEYARAERAGLIAAY